MRFIEAWLFIMGFIWLALSKNRFWTIYICNKTNADFSCSVIGVWQLLRVACCACRRMWRIGDGRAGSEIWPGQAIHRCYKVSS